MTRSSIGLLLVLAACGSGTKHGLSPDESCDNYLACLSSEDPSNFPAALAAYGSSSMCWSSSSAAQVCTQACQAAEEEEGCPCGSDADCNGPNASGGMPVCGSTTHYCAECNKDSDCPNSYKCDTSSNNCVECLTNGDCTSDAPVCSQQSGGYLCVECDDSHACAGAGVCNAGTCTSPCDTVSACVLYGGTITTESFSSCLSDDNCCANEGTCSSYQALRQCLVANCASLPSTSSIDDRDDCMTKYCASEVASCHTGGC